MRLTWCCSAASTIPFQVGAAWTVVPCARKPASACERRSVLGGLLGRLSYLAGLVRVEMALADGHEPDIYRLPHTQHQRISAGDQQSGGVPDGEPSEIGAVVGEQHRTDRLRGARWSRHRVS